MTKMPAPMTAPMPSAVSWNGPSERFSVPTPVALASAVSTSIDFFANRSAMRTTIYLLVRLILTIFHLRLRTQAPPEQIDRYPKQHEDKAGPCVLGFVTQEYNTDSRSHQDIERGQDWVAE